MNDLHHDFLRHLAQTSDAPIGLDIVAAEGSTLVVRDGRRYLDFISGIGVANIGHGHPAVLEAIRTQASRHLHVMVYGEYVIESQVLFAKRLAEFIPAEHGRINFTNSGAEAVEGALKLARKFTGRKEFIAFDGAYHGDTMAALALSGNPVFRAPFEPLPGPVRHLPYDDIAALNAVSVDTAAVIVEPVQAEGGVRIPNREFLSALRQKCTQHGALLIFDEVLTGLGRIGSLFGFNHFETIPDILVMAKALGGGLPLGAFCASGEMMAVLAHDPPLGHITTFGGHPLSCAAGLAAFDVLCGEKMCEQAAATGKWLKGQLETMAGPKLIAVRGVGLLLGLEFDRAEFARQFVAESIARGVVINWTLNADRVVRLAPPLNISREDCYRALETMHDALRVCAIQ